MTTNAAINPPELPALLNRLLCLREPRGDNQPSAMMKIVIATLLCRADEDLVCTLPERELCALLNVTGKTLRKFLREACARGFVEITKNNRFGQKQYDLRPLVARLQTARLMTGSHEKPCVYLFLDKARQLLKIGYTEDLRRRLSQVAAATGNGALEILGTVTAGRDVERDLMERFASLRIAGEWFHYRPEIVDEFMKVRDLLGTED